jgi:S1-C subfamily serine protease
MLYVRRPALVGGGRGKEFEMLPFRRLPASLLWSGLLFVVLGLSACDDGNTQSPTPESTGTAPAATSSPEAAPTRSGDALSTPEIVRLLSPSVVRVQTEGARFDILGRPVPTQGVGTGVIIDDEGHIVTNNHVVRLDARLASRVVVTLSDDRTFTAEIVGTDPPSDLAVLKIDATGLSPAKLGDVSQLEVGGEVVAIGFALDLPGGPTVTRGVVSAKDRVIEESPYSISSAIQTDASINPGNSGGPLVDQYGEVVGITTAIIGQAQNIGFAISIDLAEPLVQEIIEKGFVSRGFLGISVVDVTPSVAANFNLPVESGIGVANVEPDSPADEAGLLVNDIIVRIGDVDITNSGDLLQALTKFRAGDSVAVAFYRDSQRQEQEVTLADRPR